jgi:hypothetical protein
MCFIIPRQRNRPRQRVVWKVVELYKTSLRSWWRSDFVYYPGVIKAKGVFRNAPGWPSRGGIYVYLNEADAIQQSSKHSWSNQVVIKLRVKPTDLIAVSKKNETGGQQATYRGAFMPEDQPYVEFY